MSDEFQYDVFVSYSSKDKEWVRGELLKRIEQAGLKAFIDYRDFTRGAPSVSECERGVVESRKVLLVLTPDYLVSKWCKSEGVMIQTLDPANDRLRLLPLLKEECDPPLRIGALTHIDFTDGADRGLAWRQLLTALGAAPELPPPKEPAHPHWRLAHPYPMPPNFTGRVSERGTLNRWLNEDAAHPLLVLRALGGFGKSALTWHWLTHDVDAKKWPRVVWWSFYEGDASFDHFVVETLAYLYGEAAKAQPLSPREALEALLKALLKPGTLLVLDGFERVLRAFSGLEAAYQGDEAEHTDLDRDCVSPLAEDFLHHVALQPQLQSKVLLTTRLRPRVLEARRSTDLLERCLEEELKQMQPSDAVAFFHARGIRGHRAEIEAACASSGYHPLSLGLLAGLIAKDPQQPGDIDAATRLELSSDVAGSQRLVLKSAYESLTLTRQELLGRIACFRSPMKYEALKRLAETAGVSDPPDEGRGLLQRFFCWLHRRRVTAAPAAAETLDADLRDLVARGLVHQDTREGRFDLHPIVRHYAYDRLAAPERAAAHTRLRDYFAAVPEVKKVTRLEDLAPVIELYHHTVRAGQFDEAFTLYRDRLGGPLFYQLGAYHLSIDLLRALFPDGEDRPPRLKGEDHQGSTLSALAGSYAMCGQPRRAVPLVEQDIAVCEKQGDKRNLVVGLTNLATQQLGIGAMRDAEANLRRSIAVGREIKDEFKEAVGHQELGRLLAYRGEYAELETELAASTAFWTKTNDFDGLCIDGCYRALAAVYMQNISKALSAAKASFSAWEEDSRRSYPTERTLIRTKWLLGVAHCVSGQHAEAERHLHEALERCRRINMVDHEADILIDLARLRAATGALDEAQRLAEEARVMAERSGYVMQGADAHLELAKLAAARGDQTLAREHAQQAKDLATCDGPPDYTYEAAYDEATALLQQWA